MRAYQKIAGVLALGVVVAAGVRAWGDDEDALAKAPAAVQATVKAVVGQNKLAGFDPEQEGGKTVYEVSYELKGGGDYTIVVSGTGEVLEREVEVDPSIIPPEVIDAAKSAHPDGKIGEYAIVNAGGKLFYEIETKVGNDLHEVKISAKGKVTSDTVAPPEAPATAEKPETNGGTEKKD